MAFDLSPELRAIALEALRAYSDAPPLHSGKTPVEIESDGDAQRLQLIENAIRPLLTRYLAKSVSTADFKRQIDGINKQNPLWGFSGIKGQMFFNMLVKTADDTAGLDDQLRSAIREPTNEEDAVAILRNFKTYVTRVGEHFVDAGGDAYSRPKPGSVPFFLSYFWQIHKPLIWPVYYTNSVQVIEGMNLWQATGEVGEDYLAYKNLHETLANLFSQTSGKRFTLYDVEHVF